MITFNKEGYIDESLNDFRKAINEWIEECSQDVFSEDLNEVLYYELVDWLDDHLYGKDEWTGIGTASLHVSVFFDWKTCLVKEIE